MPVHAVIFDLDGTLLNTLGDIARSINVGLEAHGFPRAPAEEYRYRVGWGLRELARRSLPADAAEDEALVAEIMTAFSREYARAPAAETVPYEGIAALLNDLDAVGVPYAVLSNKPHDLTVAAVRDTLGLDRFVRVQGQLDGIPRKPDPTSTLQLLSEIGAASDVAGEVTFVGDSEIDMETARNAGCRAVGVSWGFRTPEQILAAGAEAICYDIKELRDELGLVDGARN